MREHPKFGSPKAPERGEYIRVNRKASGRGFWRARITFAPGGRIHACVFEGVLSAQETPESLRAWLAEHVGRPVAAMPSARELVMERRAA